MCEKPIFTINKLINENAIFIFITLTNSYDAWISEHVKLSKYRIDFICTSFIFTAYYSVDLSSMQRAVLSSLLDETLRQYEIVLRFEKRVVSRSSGDLMHCTKHTVALHVLK